MSTKRCKGRNQNKQKNQFSVQSEFINMNSFQKQVSSKDLNIFMLLKPIMQPFSLLICSQTKS